MPSHRMYLLRDFFRVIDQRRSMRPFGNARTSQHFLKDGDVNRHRRQGIYGGARGEK